MPPQELTPQPREKWEKAVKNAAGSLLADLMHLITKTPWPKPPQGFLVHADIPKAFHPWATQFAWLAFTECLLMMPWELRVMWYYSLNTEDAFLETDVEGAIPMVSVKADRTSYTTYTGI